MNNRVYIPEVSRAIEDYFSKHHISQVEASKILHVTPQAVSLQLKQPFGKNVSLKWAKAFRFNRHFLMTGEGELITEPTFNLDEIKENDSPEKALATIENLEKETGRNVLGFSEEEMTRDEEYYRSLDICAIMNGGWDTVKDEAQAYTLFRAADIQICDLKAELDYYMSECRKKVEENKKLFIENTALRRSLKESK